MAVGPDGDGGVGVGVVGWAAAGDAALQVIAAIAVAAKIVRIIRLLAGWGFGRPGADDVEPSAAMTMAAAARAGRRMNTAPVPPLFR
jgi:hypothetical protein